MWATGRRWAAATGVTVAVFLVWTTPAGGRTFSDILGTQVGRQLGDALASAVALGAPPTIAASAGLVFTFDPATGAYERETSIAGQLFLERAQPVGRGHWNVSLGYQRVKFDRFDGEDIERLTDEVPIKDHGGLVTFPRFGL